MVTHDHFPMFIDARGKIALVIGGGAVAERRIQSLLKFSFDVTVMSEQITDEIRSLCDSGRVRHLPAAFDPDRTDTYAQHFANTFMVLACTDDRQTNEQIGMICKEHDIHVNVCDAQEESTFWFPAIATSDELAMGLVGNGKSHETVRKAAAKLRHIIEERSF